MPFFSKILVAALSVVCLVMFFINITNFFSGHFLNQTINYLKINDTQADTNLAIAKNEVLNTKKQITFVGDVMLGRDVERLMLINGPDYPYKKITFDSLSSYVVANFESPIPAKHIPTPNNNFRFSVDSTFLENLKEAGFTHLSLANNHTFDYGLNGYNNTVNTIWKNYLIPFGHPTVFSTSSVTVVSVDGVKVALIALHALFNTPTKENIESVMSYAKSISDVQIVCVHWGEEYNLNQSNGQRKLATSLSLAGADIIIGHHPHVVQGIEKINDTIVFYSLGNYIFDQYFSPSVQTGLMLNLTFANGPSMQLIPVSTLETRAQPHKILGEAREQFFSNLSKRSDSSLSQFISSGQIPLTFKLATSTEVAIMAQ